MKRHDSLVLTTALVLAAPVACADAGAGGEAVVTREVVGDTTIVRTSGPGAWGGGVTLEEDLRIGVLEGADEFTFGNLVSLAVAEDGTMYVLDRQAMEVRVFAPDGSFVRRIGREGGGPGEFRQPGGMGFLPDGRLVVRDFGNARINVYSPDGEPLDSWPIPGGYSTSNPLFVDVHGSLYTDFVIDRADDGTFTAGVLRLDSTGAVADSLRRPFREHEPPRLVAQNVVDGVARATAATSVPFWPVAVTTLNRNGEFVGGIADRYAIATLRHDGTVHRIERDAPRVPVDPAESQNAVESTTRMLRQTQPNWRWDGPQPPAEKPAFREVRVGDDGRIWVRTSQPATRIPPDPDAEPDAQGRPPLDRWTEPVVYDVFDPDGTFLATIPIPERFQPIVFRGDHVWGFQRDEYNVQYVTRYRIAGTEGD